MTAREIVIPVFVPHLGCPNDCVFCNQRRISGEQKPATADDVRRTVTEALGKIGDRRGRKIQLAFFGGSFTAIPPEEQLELLDAAKEFTDSGLVDSLRLSTRPDAIDGEILARLKKYNVVTVEIGAQSLDDRVLALAGRGHTAEDVGNAAAQIKKAGFRLIIQMMTGLPGDTGESSIKTAEKIIAMRPDGVRIYPTVIVKDTALYDLWMAGRYEEHTVEKAVELCAVILPMFDEAGIPVIRLGLNPTDELSSGAAAAGAYHPALGEMVKSRMIRNRIEELMNSGCTGKRTAEIHVNPAKLSQAVGQHRCNIVWLRERFGLDALTVVTDDAMLEKEVKIRYN